MSAVAQTGATPKPFDHTCSLGWPERAGPPGGSIPHFDWRVLVMWSCPQGKALHPRVGHPGQCGGLPRRGRVISLRRWWSAGLVRISSAALCGDMNPPLPLIGCRADCTVWPATGACFLVWSANAPIPPHLHPCQHRELSRKCNHGCTMSDVGHGVDIAPTPSSCRCHRSGMLTRVMRFWAVSGQGGSGCQRVRR
jgi:hypothetical protein